MIGGNIGRFEREIKNLKKQEKYDTTNFKGNQRNIQIIAFLHYISKCYICETCNYL